jgi:hypothetical protein
LAGIQTSPGNGRMAECNGAAGQSELLGRGSM